MTEIARVVVRPKRPGWLLAVLVVATVVGIILIFASFLPLMFSAMLFDAGESVMAWTMFTAIWACPVMLLLGMTIAWIAFAARAYWLVWLGAVLGVAPILVLVAGFAIF